MGIPSRPTTSGTEVISVCVCTYRREEMLRRLLDRLARQTTEGLFSFSILVVDNDIGRTAEGIVRDFRRGSEVSVSYRNEPRKSISLARNTAVRNADGDFIAFIDDDEFPLDNWLAELYKALRKFKADGVLGPVLPHFDTNPPDWVRRSGLLERPSFPTGTTLVSRDTRTGNVLLDRAIFDGEETPFDPRFGKTGGEDVDFFKRKIEAGRVFIWCDEACVFETITPDRFTRIYFIKRALLRGVAQARLSSTDGAGIAKSLVACLIYTSALPFLLLAGHHLFMRYLVRGCDHVGKLMALCGIELMKERTF